jgi:hypothetical protein
VSLLLSHSVGKPADDAATAPKTQTSVDRNRRTEAGGSRRFPVVLSFALSRSLTRFSCSVEFARSHPDVGPYQEEQDIGQQPAANAAIYQAL